MPSYAFLPPLHPEPHPPKKLFCEAFSSKSELCWVGFKASAVWEMKACETD